MELYMHAIHYTFHFSQALDLDTLAFVSEKGILEGAHRNLFHQVKILHHMANGILIYSNGK